MRSRKKRESTGKGGESGETVFEGRLSRQDWNLLSDTTGGTTSSQSCSWGRLTKIFNNKCLSWVVSSPKMALTTAMIVLVGLAAMTTVAVAVGEENELDYGYWNYREGADSVNVASVRSVTRLLDVWGKRIFNEVKTLLHSQPSALLPDYSRVRPLSESLSDLFREVSLLHRRVNELTHRLATIEPVLRRHGYRDEQDDEEEAAAQGGGGLGADPPSAPRSMRGGPPGSLARRYPLRYTTVRRTPKQGTRVVRRRRVRVYHNGPVRVIESDDG